MDWEQIGMDALALLLPLVITAGAYYLRRFLVAKIGAEQFYQAQTWAWKAVLAAEQTIENNPAKFQYAVNLVARVAKRRGISLPYDEIQTLVEACVRDQKARRLIGGQLADEDKPRG